MRNTWLNIYFSALFFFSTICSSSKSSSIASIRDAWAGRKRRRKLKEIVGGGLAGRRQREDWSGHTRRVEEHPSWWRHLEGPISASTSVISSRFPHILPVVDWRFLPAVSLLPRRQLYTYESIYNMMHMMRWLYLSQRVAVPSFSCASLPARIFFLLYSGRSTFADPPSSRCPIS